jgi:hypothetical protein
MVGVFSEIPDVPGIILRVIVERVLDECGRLSGAGVAFIGSVVDDAGGDPGDYARVVRDGENVDFSTVTCFGLVGQHGSRNEREVSVVDGQRMGEIGSTEGRVDRSGWNGTRHHCASCSHCGR